MATTVKSVQGDYTLIANGGAGTITFVGNVVTTTTPTTISPFLTVAANNTGSITEMGLLAQTGANAFAGLRFSVSDGNVWQVSDSVGGDGSPITPYATLSTSASTYGNANVANYLPTYTGNLGTANTTPITAIFANSYFYGNGDPFIGGGSGDYGNANVQDYLPTYTGLIGGNIGLQVTGILLAETAPNGTANTQVATTAFVQNALGGGGGGTYGDANVISLLGAFGSNTIFTAGNITAGYFFGDGGNLTGMYSNANVANYLPTYSGNLESLNGDIFTTGNISCAGNITAQSILRSNLGIVTLANIDLIGNLNFNSTNSAIALGSGNVLAGNIFGSGNLTLDGFCFLSNVDTALGTPGNISAAGLLVANIYNVGGNTANIGSPSTPFGTVYALATSALYADLAEMYTADKDYEPGTVVEFGGTAELTQTTTVASSRVAGVVSTQPAFVMNERHEGEYTVALALAGRVPCRVVGPVQKGDLIVSSSVPGVGCSLPEALYKPGCVIGKALDNYNNTEVGVIEVVVGVR